MLENEVTALGATSNQIIGVYEGKHRIFEMQHGIAFIPVGDRNRCKPEYGVDVVEDRDSDPNIRRI